jgi:hypothetical protein
MAVEQGSGTSHARAVTKAVLSLIALGLIISRRHRSW